MFGRLHRERPDHQQSGHHDVAVLRAVECLGVERAGVRSGLGRCHPDHRRVHAAGDHPGSTAPASGQLTAPDGAPLDDKAKRYLQALRSQNVTLLGDTDNGVALSLATYVCDAQKKNTDPVTTKAYVTALVAPGTQNTAEANAKADKVIKAAQDNYC